MQIHSRQTLPLFALLGLLSALPAQGQSSSSQPMPPSNARAATSLTTLQGSGGGFGFQGSTNYEGGWWEFERTSGLLMEEIMTNLGHGQSIDQIHTSFGPIELNHNHRGWAMPSEVGPWSHGYEGVVLGSGIFQEINLTFPAGTRAFDTYIQPFVEGAYHFGVAATFSDGSTVEFNVNTVNPGGARQLGFYCVPGVSLTHVAFTGGYYGAYFYLGEMRISRGSPIEFFCDVNDNSTGGPALMQVHGLPSIAAGELNLAVSSVPNNFCVIAGATAKSTSSFPFWDGYLCLSGTITRMMSPTQASGHRITLDLDPGSFGLMHGSYYFQCWFRDPAAGLSGVNTSDAVGIQLLP